MTVYTNSKIYIIFSKLTDSVYIGSTTQTLKSRIATHRSSYKRYMDKKSAYTSSYEIIKYPDNQIKLIKNVDCTSRHQLCRVEGDVIRGTPNTVNKSIAGRSCAEYRRDNIEKEKLRQRIYSKKYYAEHKEAIRNKQGVKLTCQCGSIHSYSGKSQHLQTIKHKLYTMEKLIDTLTNLKL